VRRLPIRGEVLVALGSDVRPDQVVAHAMLPGALQTMKMTEKLGVEAQDVPGMVKVKVGDPIKKGDLIVETKALFGLMKTRVASDYEGTIESISDVTGSILVREPPTPVEIRAYVKGKISDVLPEEGVTVETDCAMVQGIFGVGGERLGTIEMAVSDPSEMLDGSKINASHKGKILVGGSGITYDALTKASEMGVVGLIAGGIRDSDLMKYLGYDIGVAITGQEAIPISVLVTEGFGYLAMAQRTFDLLKSLAGQEASMNGATQIRAGVIRPEILVPHQMTVQAQAISNEAFELKAGTPIRIIREPYFGLLGTVTELPAQLETLESGTQVRVLKAKLQDGREAVVPRANVEIIAAG
jgi:biotin carboxyl carrier protein